MNIPSPNDVSGSAAVARRAMDKRKLSKTIRPTLTSDYDVSVCETLFCRVSGITVTPINHVDGQYFKVLNRSDGEVQFAARVEYLGVVYASPVSLAPGESLTVIYDANDNVFVATSFLSSSVIPSSINNTLEA